MHAGGEEGGEGGGPAFWGLTRSTSTSGVQSLISSDPLFEKMSRDAVSTRRSSLHLPPCKIQRAVTVPTVSGTAHLLSLAFDKRARGGG